MNPTLAMFSVIGPTDLTQSLCLLRQLQQLRHAHCAVIAESTAVSDGPYNLYARAHAPQRYALRHLRQLR